MPKRLKPTQYVVNGDCSQKCSLNIANLGDERCEMVLGWYAEGLNDFKIEERVVAAGFKLSHGSIGRHRRKHLTEAAQIEEDEANADLSHVEMLEKIIAKGATQIPQWRITPSEFFKAMEQLYKLTQGSTMDAMYNAMAAAGAEEEDEDEDEEMQSVSERLPPEVLSQPEVLTGREAEVLPGVSLNPDEGVGEGESGEREEESQAQSEDASTTYLGR